jgi:uncharacterized membrane protein YkvA (DUF1232 family)
MQEIEMTNRKLLVPPQGGMMKDFVKRLKLIGRLMGDNRVSAFIKVLPLASLAYLIFPFDLVPGIALPIIGALDDAAILWIGSTLFVELCPDNVVQEHKDSLDMESGEDTGEIVDAETRDIDNK